MMVDCFVQFRPYQYKCRTTKRWMPLVVHQVSLFLVWSQQDLQRTWPRRLGRPLLGTVCDNGIFSCWVSPRQWTHSRTKHQYQEGVCHVQKVGWHMFANHCHILLTLTRDGNRIFVICPHISIINKNLNLISPLWNWHLLISQFV